MGGDHKCPLCSATFTRPQHVGRHLRAHTGDRPYECKECPLRFARSDLLSRHVNKAHKPPEEGDASKKGDKAGKKARRKSIATAMTDDDGDAPDADGPIASEKARRSSFAHPQGTYPGQANQAQGLNGGYQTQGQAAQQQQQQQQQQQAAGSQLQAQKLYPHHPLLASTPQAPGQTGPYTSQWTSTIQTAGLNGAVTAMPPNTYGAGVGITNPLYSTTAAMGLGAGGPYNALPMRLTGSEQGGLAAQQNRSPNIASWAFDFGFKKRACDQCNHSKVRCDFSDPCARCSHRNLKCTYNKPSKSRGMATPVNLAGRLSYPMSAGTSSTYLASSVSPVSQGSQHSSQGAVGSTANTSPISRASMPGAPGLPRRGSIGSAPVNAYASAVPTNLASSAQYLQQLQQQNQERQQLAAQQWMTTAASMGGVPSMLPGGYPVTATMQQQPLYPMQQQQPQQPQQQQPQQQQQQQQQQQPQQVSPLSNPSVGPAHSQGLSPSNGTALQVSLGTQANNGAQSHALQKKKSSSASPGTHLAATPALTLGSSQTTSPSSSEELLERKGSQMGALAGQNWQQPQLYQPMPQLPGGQQQPGGLVNAPNLGDKAAGVDSKPNLSLLQPTFAQDGTVQMSGISPTTAGPSMDFLNMQFGAPDQMGVAWPQQQMDAVPVATIDPRTQFRSNNANEDDDTASVHGSSSAASVYHFDPDENMANVFAQPRRSSVGHSLWTNAFDSMTLQDGTMIPGSAVSDALNDPFTASQVAQAVSQRRPTFPLEIQGMDQNSAKIPSMSDVKDLWKLFMSDPMTSSVTPSGDRNMDFGNLAAAGANVVTPRPDMGRRTLSKSNSMPDLKSPQGESTSASSGATATPRAVDSKATSYVPGTASGAAALSKTEAKDDGEGGNAQADGQPDDAAMRKWTEEIRHRQASFNFQPAMNGKIGGKGNTPPAGGPSPATSAVSPPSNPGSTTSQPSMLPPENPPTQQQQQQQMPPPPNRPMASIFQRSGALQQTLAPERTPSWGQSFEMGIPTQASFAKPGPSKLSSTMTASNAGTDGDAQNDGSRPAASTAVPIMAGSTSTSVPTSQARPGNKRLASQTLMALEGKKADLSGGAGSEFDMTAFDDFTFDLSSAGGGSGAIGGGGGITPGLQAMQGLWGIGSVSEMSGGKA